MSKSERKANSGELFPPQDCRGARDKGCTFLSRRRPLPSVCPEPVRPAQAWALEQAWEAGSVLTAMQGPWLPVPGLAHAHRSPVAALELRVWALEGLVMLRGPCWGDRCVVHCAPIGPGPWHHPNRSDWSAGPSASLFHSRALACL